MYRIIERVMVPSAKFSHFWSNSLQDNAGNFMAWPGTHRQFAKYFEIHGADPELKLGIPPVDLPQPVQIKAKTGDMIFAHYQLAHAVAPNLSHAIRYAVYIRKHHADRPKDFLDVLIDIWKYWYGMSEALGKVRGLCT
jgi:ectoine hydroxylase-related dioxygenase (phytanoyl-CoA dioxygenase family)